VETITGLTLSNSVSPSSVKADVYG